MTAPRPVFRSDADLQRELVIGRTHESIYLDFKTDSLAGHSRIPEKTTRGQKKTAYAKETARDIVQFANTLGGTLLYGVAEADDATAWRVATAVPGVPDPDAFMEFLDHSVRPLVQPTGYAFTWKPLTWTDGASVVALDAPPLAAGVASVWRQGAPGIEFYRRTDNGKTAMSPPDVEAHLMDTSRHAYLLALELLHESRRVQARADERETNCVLGSAQRDLGAERRVTSEFYMGPRPPKNDALGRIREEQAIAEAARRRATLYERPIDLVGVTKSELSLKHGSRRVAVPLSRVKDLWLRGDGRIGIVLAGTLVIPASSEEKPIYFEPGPV